LGWLWFAVGQGWHDPALPAAGEADWKLDEITDHHYAQAIMQDTFKPADFMSTPVRTSRLFPRLSPRLMLEQPACCSKTNPKWLPGHH
jgi:hypothetical protein